LLTKLGHTLLLLLLLSSAATSSSTTEEASDHVAEGPSQHTSRWTA
jgi:hypothetical protein